MVSTQFDKDRYEKELRKEIEKLREDLSKTKGAAISNQIAVDWSEIKDISIIIYCFNDADSPVRYIRTEPLFSFKEKNFDVVLYGKKCMILISVKESIQGSNIPGSINELIEYSKEILENISITDKEKGVKIKVLDYFEGLINDKIIDTEFVLATQRPSIIEINNHARDVGCNFSLWHLNEKNNKAFITEEVINGEGQFFGHKSSELKDHLKLLKERGKIYNDILTFIFSSSRYLKATKISIPLSKKDYFNFNDWKKTFEIDIYGWHEFEKQIIYKNYINYGLECTFLSLVEDFGDILSNKYKIKSVCMKANLLEKDIIKKITAKEIRGELQGKVPLLKAKIKKNILIKGAEERGESLKKFF